MACTSCKKTNEELYEESVNNHSETKKTHKKILNYILKFGIFLLLSMIIVPIIIPVTIYVLYITIVSKESINLIPLLVYLGNKLYGTEDKEPEDEDDDDNEEEFENDEDYDKLSESEYELISPNDITIIK
jgi:TM2 domain-containing membrane protein YozV